MRGRFSYLRVLIVFLLCLPGVKALADTADSTTVVASDRGVMLNAESATAPRVINIGLPESASGAAIFVDGVRAALGVPRGIFHWAGGNSYNKVAPMPLIESVIRTGDISSPVNSWTKFGGEEFEGRITAGTSSNGLIRFDGWVGGPIKRMKGWSYFAGIYLNYDPTSVNAPSCTYVDRKQIYQIGLTRRWKASELGILYRYSWCGDQIAGMYNTAPFRYNGDGSVTVFDGFRMGYDQYFPSDDNVSYMDLATGRMREASLSDFNDRRIHDISLLWSRRTESGWNLRASAHAVLMPQLDQVKAPLSGTDRVNPEDGFTLSDGTPYEGYVQSRVVTMEKLRTYDFEIFLQAEKKFRNHEVSSGIDVAFADQYEAASSLTFAHSAEASPERLYYRGKNAWNLNTNALYYDADKFWAAFFLYDKIMLSKNVSMLSGIRLCPVRQFIYTAARLNGETKNRRVDGFNLSDKSLAELHYIKHGGLTYAVSESLNWAFAGGYNAVVEGFYSMTTKSTSYFKNASIPSRKAIGNAQARAGVTYANPWLSVAGIISYITSWNNAANISVTKQIEGISETIPWVAQYGIGTKGVTFDGNIFFGGFKCHALFTWQDPRYHNYKNVFRFSDGSTQTVDYTNNQCTGISKIMVEIDPSYKWRNWRVWFSARYYSRQYASRTNFAYFNGRWETFGGLDWNFSKDCKVSLSFVNLLHQGGVKGSIDIADTIEDKSALAGYVMAGTFIRPFSLDLSVTCSF